MPGNLPKVHFPLPPRYWDGPGDAPSYRLWLTQFENYIYSIDSQRLADEKMGNEFKNRLLYSILGTEGITTFVCTPEAQDPAGTSFTNFSKAVKAHFQLMMSPTRAFFNFQSRRQHEGESTNHFSNALRTLLVDCEVQLEEECEKLLGHQLVFGCHDSSTLQKLLTLKEMSFETILAEMESQEKANKNASTQLPGYASAMRSVSPDGSLQETRREGLPVPISAFISPLAGLTISSPWMRRC